MKCERPCVQDVQIATVSHLSLNRVIPSEAESMSALVVIPMQSLIGDAICGSAFCVWNCKMASLNFTNECEIFFRNFVRDCFEFDD